MWCPRRALLQLLLAFTWTFRFLPSCFVKSEITLTDLWAIQEGNLTFEEETNTILVDHDIHEALSPSTNVRAEIYNPFCSGSPLSDPSDGILLQMVGAETGAQIFQIDPSILASNSDVFDGDIPPGPNGEPRASMTFCLRYMLWTGPESDPQAMQVNYLETTLIIYFDLTAGFSIILGSITKLDPSKSEVQEREGYTVEAYICDPVTWEEIEVTKIYQGQTVSICIILSERAINDSIIIDSVWKFIWTDETNGVITTQNVVEDGVPSDAGEYTCSTSGRGTCLFQSLPYADFFKEEGTVVGIGEVRLGFVQLERERDLSSRSLQNVPDTPGASGFGVTVDLATLDDRPNLLVTAGGRCRRFPWWVLLIVVLPMVLH